ncbi:MAG: IS110 family RNA-guided transposase [Methylococcaceae bacterium]
MFQVTVGVDIAKKKFDVALLIENKYKHKHFTNDNVGFEAFIAWLSTCDLSVQALICMEATGAYSLPLADFLVVKGYSVSLVNPAKINAFAKSELSRAKTDKADAKLIARYALSMKPGLWTPPPPEMRRLQALTRRLEHLLEIQQMERNRLDTADDSVTGSINTLLKTVEDEIKAIRQATNDLIDNDPTLDKRRKLLESIPGIGAATVAHLLLVLSPHQGFITAKQIVAFAGLAPALRESGQWTGKTRISKNGDPILRKILYMPALSAWGHNPVIRTFCQRLKANGKNGKAIACAAMRKLIHIAFGVLKSGEPFDPLWAYSK